MKWLFLLPGLFLDERSYQQTFFSKVTIESKSNSDHLTLQSFMCVNFDSPNKAKLNWAHLFNFNVINSFEINQSCLITRITMKLYIKWIKLSGSLLVIGLHADLRNSEVMHVSCCVQHDLSTFSLRSPDNICSKSTMRTQEKAVKYIES